MLKHARLLLLAALSVIAVCAVVPTGASAEAIYRYNVEMQYKVQVFNLNPGLYTTLRLMRGATEIDRNDFGTGEFTVSLYDDTQAGDVVEVYQSGTNPATADPPDSAPTETFTVPALTIDATPGSPTVSGNTDPSAAVRVYHGPYCDEDASDSTLAVNAGGAYTASFPVALQNREYVSVTAIQPDGDRVSNTKTLPGDAGCLYIDGSASPRQIADDEFPFNIYDSGGDSLVAPTSRIVLRRGGAIVSEANNSAGYNSLDLTATQRPLPGDVIEIYRPMGAATPTRTYTIPPVSSIFDAGNDTVAVNSPAASLVEVSACTAYSCAKYSGRAARDVPAGRTIFSFATPLSYDRAHDILADDQVSADWTSPDAHVYYSIDAVPGDLTAPIGKITLKKKLILKKIHKKIKFSLKSNETGTAVSTLTTPPPAKAKKSKKGKGKSHKSAAKKPITLAAAKSTLKVGTNKISLKVSKKGAGTIKKIIASGKSQKATLQITITDASGNVTTIVKTTKLALK